jgi:hypothetical protein
LPRPDIEIKRALIVVRTYPVPAHKGVEVSCTAAITDKGEWLRLFPVPYRRLHPSQKFSKYQWIEVGVVKATDPRPESHKIIQETITIKSPVLPTTNGWQVRKQIIFPLKAGSMCALKRQRDDHGSPTLGVFKPAVIEKLIIKPSAAAWTQAELEIMRQGDLFESESKEDLEKIPFDFYYQYRCNESTCNGHKMKCTDWEMSQSWRNWRTQYGNDWEAAFREKYETEMRDRFDTHFYVGTINQHPKEWIIVGLFYPPISAQADELQAGLF